MASTEGHTEADKTAYFVNRIMNTRWAEGQPGAWLINLTPKYVQPECLTCRGTGVAEFDIDTAIDLLLLEGHFAALFCGREDEIRAGLKQAAEERQQTVQKCRCPDCLPKVPPLWSPFIVLLVVASIALGVWLLLSLTGTI